LQIKKVNKEKLCIALGVIAFLALLIWFIFSSGNFELLKSVFIDDLSREELLEKFDVFDWTDYVTITILAALQVVCALLPAEPVQVLAGLSFGFPVGLLCCMIGVLIGGTVIFLLQKLFGDRLRNFFLKKLHLDLEKIAQSSQYILIIFILYFLPAIPYGMICFFAASIGIRYRRYIVMTLLGALPSVCIGVGLGYITVVSDRMLSVAIFGVLIILLAIVLIKKDYFFAKLNGFADANKREPQNAVRKPNGFVLNTVYFALRCYYWLCGVQIRAINKVGTPEKPSVILCSHGSFIDFIFAATLVRKFKPNFIVARLYFYDKALEWLVRAIGGFPKSMFALDMESTKNCLRVLKGNGILAMMPEARLSTTGRFEDIQPNTYSFLKKSGVPIYTIRFQGDYFADPKWGKGFRRGAVVEAELDILYTAEEVQNLSVDEIKAGVEARLAYDEFQWIQQRPQIRYRSRRMAEGLENILTVCPRCRQKYTLTTKKEKIFCDKCGYLTSLDQRYLFTGDFQFRDLTQWYDWQKERMRREIAENENFALTASVELRLPSKGRGLTRHGGNGVCTLSRDGLTYSGTKDGETVELCFPIKRIYRLLFGAGENFELYNGTEILYFVPEETRSNVDWYVASMLLYDEYS